MVSAPGTITRFRSKTERVGECLEWGGYRDKDGYGIFHVNRHPYRAHRIAYLMAYGDLPNLFVLHACDNPCCVRPEHLHLGTQKDNMREMVGRGRSLRGAASSRRRYPERYPRGDAHHARAKPECLARGSRHGRARLTEEAVTQIRAAAARGESRASLARRFGVSYDTVRLVCNRVTWRHVK